MIDIMSVYYKFCILYYCIIACGTILWYIVLFCIFVTHMYFLLVSYPLTCFRPSGINGNKEWNEMKWKWSGGYVWRDTG
jgi:hypothetical protein